MKTVEFRYRGQGLYIVDGEHNWGDSYGIYVLASEANERIKVLEENLRILLSAKITSQDGAISLATNEERYQKARAALEVK
jgi:hypothetical protein